MQGLIASLNAVTAIVSPLFLTQLFGYFTAPGGSVFFPGAPFLAAAMIVVIALIPFRLGLRVRPLPETP